jgi:hypothetical protein
MRIEPKHVRAITAMMRKWGYTVHAHVEEDLVAEFDVRSDIDENKVGKFSRKSQESRKSALRARPRSGTQRRRIYEYIRDQQHVDRETIALHLGMSENSVRPRVLELIEGGWVKPSGTILNRRGQEVETLEVAK